VVLTVSCFTIHRKGILVTRDGEGLAHRSVLPVSQILLHGGDILISGRGSGSGRA
jgi:hypothetical protein